MIYNRFEQVAALHPGKAAVIAGDRRLTFSDIQSEVERTCVFFRSHGIDAGSPVVVLLPNSADFVITALSLFRLGAICVPVNTGFPSDEILYYLDTASSRTLLHAGAGSAGLLAGNYSNLRLIDIREAAAASSGALSGAPIVPETMPATYTYSSGSTGKPKRVTRTHGQWLAEFDALLETIRLTDEDCILCAVPLFHTHGFGNCLMAAMLSGSTLVLLSGEFSPRAAARAMEQQHITIFPAVPFMAKMIVDTPFKAPPDFSSLRLCFTAGAALPLDVSRRFLEKFGLPLRQLYGSTETGAVSINFDGENGTEESIGLPLKGVRVDIVDESGRLLPDGEVGEIAIKSPAMTRQYDGLPEITREHFIEDYFVTGDLAAKNADGRIFIKGRKKLLINVAGNKVDPLDVEAIILKHPKVNEVVVLGKPHDVYGEMVKAVIVSEAGCSTEEIMDLCSRYLAEYKIPRVIEFRSEIPKSPLGKILRKYL